MSPKRSPLRAKIAGIGPGEKLDFEDLPLEQRSAADLAIEGDLIFDLDGTISDPLVGIARSINHALAAFGYPPLPENAVSPHIGAPLDIVFRRVVPGLSDELLREIVPKYRKRYAETGYAENILYPGIPDALERLASAGARMGICTSKHKAIAEEILGLFDLRAHFAFVSGGDVGVEKAAQISALLEEGTVRGTAVMIGDRAVDVLAARACGLSSIGVLWGYGSREELSMARPDRLLRSPSELAEVAKATAPGQR